MARVFLIIFLMTLIFSGCGKKEEGGKIYMMDIKTGKTKAIKRNKAYQTSSGVSVTVGSPVQSPQPPGPQTMPVTVDDID